MGLFKGKSYYVDGVEYAFMICWGKLTRNPKVECVNKTKVEFGMQYYKHTFMNCIHWGEDDTSDIMSSLEKGDKILCLGVWSKKPYTKKNGEVIDWSELNCEIVIPMGVINSLLDIIASPTIQKLLDKDKADAFEGQYEEEADDDAVYGFDINKEYDDDYYRGSII